MISIEKAEHQNIYQIPTSDFAELSDSELKDFREMHKSALVAIFEGNAYFIPFDKEIYIGRDSSNTIVSHNEYVSRKHCKFTVSRSNVGNGETRELVHIEDENSTNGTYIPDNKNKIRDRHILIEPSLVAQIQLGDQKGSILSFCSETSGIIRSNSLTAEEDRTINRASRTILQIDDPSSTLKEYNGQYQLRNGRNTIARYKNPMIAQAIHNSLLVVTYISQGETQFETIATLDNNNGQIQNFEWNSDNRPRFRILDPQNDQVIMSLASGWEITQVK